jgi:hypothetical protein
MYGSSVDQRIKDALKPLLDRRSAEAGALYKEFERGNGYLTGDTASKWLARPPRKIRMDVVNPARGVPYHVLIVAPPDEIPFEFQYGLDVYWSVGRLWFDSPEQFRQYADSVVRYETMANPPTSRHAAIFSPRHDFDKETQLFCRQVAEPLSAGDSVSKPIGFQQQFQVNSFIGASASKQTLTDIFGGNISNGPPALLFSGSHGMGFDLNDPRLPATQGALVCQDWGGYGNITEDHWFSAKNLAPNSKVHGLIHFLFACYGGGCPKHDNFSRQNGQPAQIAPKAQMAALPQALLSHPDGSALAVLCHVERAWAFSFQSDRGGAQTEGFRDVIDGILLGDRLGRATDQFNLRWGALSIELSEILNDIQFGRTVLPAELENRWVARDDARNYIIFGDPAVRLRVDDMAELFSATARRSRSDRRAD